MLRYKMDKLGITSAVRGLGAEPERGRERGSDGRHLAKLSSEKRIAGQFWARLPHWVLKSFLSAEKAVLQRCASGLFAFLAVA